MIGSHYCPVIVKPFHCISACRNHRLYGKCHTFVKLDTSAFLCKIRYLRVFVEFCSDSVSHQITDNAVPVTFIVCSNCI